MSHAALLQQLVETAGIALAAETDYPERVNGRRKKRAAKNERLADQRAYFGAILRQLRSSQAPTRPLPLRGPCGRFIPDRPTPEQIEELRKRYHSLGMVLPRLDSEGRFIPGDPLLQRSENRKWFNPPRRSQAS